MFIEMDTKIAIVLICALPIYLEGISAKKYYEVLPKPTVCTVLDTDIVYNYTCVTKVINRTVNSRNRIIYFQPGVQLNNYHLFVQLFRKLGTTFRPLPFTFDQDLCAFMNGSHSSDSSLLMKTLKIDLKNGNMYEPCPMSGIRYEKDVVTDYNRLPDVVPIGEYRFDLTGYSVVGGVKKKFMLTQLSAEFRTIISRG